MIIKQNRGRCKERAFSPSCHVSPHNRSFSSIRDRFSHLNICLEFCLVRTIRFRLIPPFAAFSVLLCFVSLFFSKLMEKLTTQLTFYDCRKQG